MTTAKEPKRKSESQTDWARIESQEQGLEPVNTSDPDAPVHDEEWFARADCFPRHNKVFKPNIDRDVLEWFEKYFLKYKTRINQVLRAYMDQKMKPKVPAYPEMEKARLVSKFDPEVIAWLKSNDGDYEARMSRVLRDFMEWYTAQGHQPEVFTPSNPKD